LASKIRRQTLEYLKYQAFALETITNAMELLRHLPEGADKRYLRDQIRNYLYNNHYSCKMMPECPIKPEYKLLIRDDCNGNISAVDKAYQSFHYRYALKNPDRQSRTHAEYAEILATNQAWQEIKEFSAYRAIEKVLLEKMKEHNFQPDLVRMMKINDFRDFVRMNCGAEFANYRGRVSFVKQFIHAREEEFRNMLDKVNVDKRYTEALVDRMFRYGEAWNVIVCDETGTLIKGPEFNRHHKYPVSSPHELKSLKEANDNKNLCLMEKHTHEWLHGLECASIRGGILHFEKIMVPENAACIVNFDNYICHDFDNPERQFPSPKPLHSNFIYLNKLAETTLRLSRVANENKRSKSSAAYVNKSTGYGR